METGFVVVVVVFCCCFCFFFPEGIKKSGLLTTNVSFNLLCFISVTAVTYNVLILFVLHKTVHFFCRRCNSKTSRSNFFSYRFYLKFSMCCIFSVRRITLTFTHASFVAVFLLISEIWFFSESFLLFKFYIFCIAETMASTALCKLPLC